MNIVLAQIGFTAAALGIAALGSPAVAQSPEEFYKGNTITLVVPFAPGGATADYATFVSEDLPKYIPGNPAIRLEFMPGAGGVRATNHFYNVMPKDGTSLIVPDEALVIAQRMNPDGVEYDAAKINWLGTMVPYASILMIRKDTDVKSLDDLKSKEVFIGASGVGSETFFYPMLTNGLLGTKMKVVPGFSGGTAEVLLAVESGEMHGSVNSWQRWERSGDLLEKMTPILAYGGGREPALPDIPNLLELISDEQDKQIVSFMNSPGVIGRSVATTPEIPQDRLDVLRAAFDALKKDSAFIERMKARKIPISPNAMGGVEATEFVAKLAATPDDLIERARQLISEP